MSLESDKFKQEINDDIQLDLKKITFTAFRTPIMLTFVSEKNRPLLLAKGVHQIDMEETYQ